MAGYRGCGGYYPAIADRVVPARSRTPRIPIKGAGSKPKIALGAIQRAPDCSTMIFMKSSARRCETPLARTA